MKKHAKLISLFLALIIFAGIFAGCGSSDYAMTANGEKYSAKPYAFYAYWYRDLWNTNVYLYTGSDDLTSKLSTEISDDGKTLKQYIIEQTESQYIDYIIIEQKFRELGLSFTDEIKTQTEYEFQHNFIESYTEDQLNNIYKTLGLTADEIKDILEINYKRQMIIDHYFGEGGEKEISEETIKNSFTNDYARFKYIAFAKTDDSGNNLSTDKTLEKYNTVKDIINQLNNGANFEELIQKYSEAYVTVTDDYSDDEKKSAESLNEVLTIDGLIIGKDGTILQDYTYGSASSVLDSTLVNKIFALNNNEYSYVETDTGYWILKRCDINEDERFYDNCRDAVYNNLLSEPYTELFESWKKDFTYTMNEKVVEKYSPDKISALFFDKDSFNTSTDESSDTDNDSTTSEE